MLESIDGKLGAILVLLLDSYIRDTEIAKPKLRSVDKMLADAGLTTPQIAALLGKTERAVQMQLAAKVKAGSEGAAKKATR